MKPIERTIVKTLVRTIEARTIVEMMPSYHKTRSVIIVKSNGRDISGDNVDDKSKDNSSHSLSIRPRWPWCLCDQPSRAREACCGGSLARRERRVALPLA